MVKFDVNWKMVPVKAVNFLFYAGLACYMPYKPIFQKQLGLSSTQNGLINAIDKIVGIPAQPLSGAIADKTKSIKMVMLFWLIFSAVFVFPMYFIPEVDFGNLSRNLICCKSNGALQCFDSMNSFLKCNFTSAGCNQNDNEMYTNCKVAIQNNTSFDNETPVRDFASCKLQNSTLQNKLQRENVTCLLTREDHGEIYGSTFAFMFLLTATSSIFLSPAPSLIDASACQALGTDKVKNYGLQRLWGAIGYGITALTAGLVTDKISRNNGRTLEDVNYLFSFITACVCFLVTAAVCLRLNIKTPGAHNIFSGMMSLLKHLKIVLFFAVVYISGSAIGFQYSMLFWYVMTLPGASQAIVGLAVVANAVIEIPLYIYSGKLAKNTSYNFLLTFGLFCYGLRFMGYSLMSQAWHVVLIEMLHGPAFALPVTAMNVKATLLSPPGMIATTVGVTQSVYWGFGYTTGALLGGVVYEKYGPVSSFRGMMVICFVSSIFYWVSVKIESMCNPPMPETETKDHPSAAAIADEI